jgi:phage tail sheath protein FI
VTFRELTADPAVLDLLNELDTAIAAGNQAAMPALELRLAESLAAYRNMLAGLNDLPTPCPPSGAIAGIYAQVDRQRGVWKAPANVSLTGVVGLTANFTAGQLEKLNVDAIAGKSINAIRTLAGKGTLVWGARTLAGNDNEWRYISVRRFFNTVEEAIRKSSAWVVFEPNDANTWVRLVGMIENYLNLQWRAGALQGAKPEYAFYVKCGLGATMTGQDILDGSLIVEVGMAAVRPAEFIILKFMHKMQQP